MSGYDRLAPFIQKYIYDHRWDALRDVQEQAICAVMDTPGHVLISAGTASGKTEAAFFPIITWLWEKQPASFGAIYIGPLKALINDQFERLEGLIREAEIPLYAWHGDRSSSEKRRAMKKPQGILQITPESLEGLLMHYPGDVQRMFAELGFIVIDEIHAFMGSDRGTQLQCQLNHLDRLLGREVRRVGLSATIQNIGDAGDWLAAGSSLKTKILQCPAGQRKLNLAVRYNGMPGDKEEQSAVRMKQAEAVYRQVRGRKCLVFTPSRNEAEQMAGRLRKVAEDCGEPDIYYVHHGSISAMLRGETEEIMRSGDQPAVTVATKTLEMGIDLGNLERVIQIGCPDSCSSFVQRLGRTGRRSTPAVMSFFADGDRSFQDFETLPWVFLRIIAMIQLHLEEKWVEPFRVDRCPYSLLFHQTLSYLMRVQECTAAEMAQYVLTLPAFAYIDKADYRLMLKQMLKDGVLDQTDAKTVIPGLIGEKLAGNYQFLGVFQTNDGYTVFCDQQELGQVEQWPQVGSLLALNGRSWRVVLLDSEHRQIFVQPENKSASGMWKSGGCGEVADHVVEKIRDVLAGDQEFAYLLDSGSKQALQDARDAARLYSLDSWYTPQDTHKLLLHPWMGTRKIKTLYFLLNQVFRNELKIGDLKELDFAVYAETKLTIPAFLSALREGVVQIQEDDLIPLAPDLPVKKYDAYVPSALRKKAYIYDQLDVPGLQQFFQFMK